MHQKYQQILAPQGTSQEKVKEPTPPSNEKCTSDQIQRSWNDMFDALLKYKKENGHRFLSKDCGSAIRWWWGSVRGIKANSDLFDSLE